MWEELVSADEELATSSFVLVETYALLQSRLGIDAVRAMHDEMVALITVHWVHADLFSEAVSALLLGNRRRVSLVDSVSFIIMRRLGIARAFAWDAHFIAQGFGRD